MTTFGSKILMEYTGMARSKFLLGRDDYKKFGRANKSCGVYLFHKLV